MRKNVILVALLGFLLFCLSPNSTLSQETSGSIKGTVSFEEEPLPGAEVSVSSESLMGTRSLVTNSKGSYLFPDLPPGKYALMVTLDGFKRSIVENIVVSLEGTALIDVEMNIGGLQEEVTVMAESVLVDAGSTQLSTNITKEFIDALPKGRDYDSMIHVAPSVVEDMFGAGISGGTGGENQFYVEGMTVTGVMKGNDDVSKVVYEFIEEVETKTGGYEAQYGGALGGVVNVITKSGGNDYHGQVRFNYQSDMLYREPKIGIYGAGATNEFNYYDVSLSLGGYLLKDKIWFFTAWAPSWRSTDHTPESLIGEETRTFTQKDTSQYFAGKLSFLLHPKHKVTLTAFGDPGTTTGGNPGSLRSWDRSWEAKKKYGTTNAVLKYNGTVGNSLMFDVLAGLYYSNPVVMPRYDGADEPMIVYRNGYMGLPYNYTSGGFGSFEENAVHKRWSFSADFTKFWGNHTIKGGVQYLNWVQDEKGGYSGGYIVTRYPSYYIEQSLLKEGNSFNEDLAIFLQDSWRVTSRLHVNLGLRIEDQKIHATDPSRFFNPHETVIHFTFGDQISPRLGLTYDLFGDGKSKLFASYGKFFELIPLDMSALVLGNVFSSLNFYDYSGFNFFGFTYGSGDTLVAGMNEGEAELEAPYVEEYILGFEREFSTDFSLSVRGVYKRLGMHLEDGSFDQGASFFIFNPGVHFVGSWDTDPLGFPEATRKYRALEIVLKKRYSNNYQFSMSYTYARLQGNTAGFAFHEYEANNANITPAFDFPDLMYNAEGNLYGDRPHQFKFDGSYRFPFGLVVGTSFRLISGAPLTKMGDHPTYPPIVFLEKRGTSGRLPMFHQLDLHLEYAVKVTSKSRLGFYVDVFNAYNSRVEGSREMLYTIGKLYGLDGGIAPPWQADPESDNPYYGKATAYQSPLSAILGVKFQF